MTVETIDPATGEVLPSLAAPEITAALAIPALGSNPHPTKGLDR